MRERDGSQSPKSTSNDTIHKVKPNILTSSDLNKSESAQVDESLAKLNMKVKMSRMYKEKVKKNLVQMIIRL